MLLTTAMKLIFVNNHTTSNIKVWLNRQHELVLPLLYSPREKYPFVSKQIIVKKNKMKLKSSTIPTQKTVCSCLRLVLLICASGFFTFTWLGHLLWRQPEAKNVLLDIPNNTHYVWIVCICGWFALLHCFFYSSLFLSVVVMVAKEYIEKQKKYKITCMFYTDTHTRSLLNTRFRAQKRSKFTIRLTGKIPLSALFQIVKEIGTKRLYICVCVFFIQITTFLLFFSLFPYQLNIIHTNCTLMFLFWKRKLSSRKTQVGKMCTLALHLWHHNTYKYPILPTSRFWNFFSSASTIAITSKTVYSTFIFREMQCSHVKIWYKKETLKILMILCSALSVTDI